MSADNYTCELCGALVFTDHRAHHEANLCPALQRRLKTPPKPKRRRQPRKAVEPSRYGKVAKCALPECGADFVSQGVTHRYCCPRHADVARRGTVGEIEEARQALEMAPLAREQELVRRAAEAVPMLAPEANYRLWLRCLGVAA
jgi:hypothetical protein